MWAFIRINTVYVEGEELVCVGQCGKIMQFQIIYSLSEN